MTDEEIGNEEEIKHRGVYLREGRYVAADYDGPDGLVTMVGGESIADDLAAKLNAELEGETMATKKNGKKTLAAKPKAEKKARVAKPRAEKGVTEAA